MKLYKVEIVIGTNEDYPEDELEKIAESISDEMENIDNIVRQKLDRIRAVIGLYVEVNEK